MHFAEYLGRFIDLFYIAPFSRIVSRRIFRYAVCGGGNMVLDLVWYFIIYHYIVAEQFINLGFIVISPHVASLIIVFPITFLTGFWLNRNVVFDVADYNGIGQLTRYAISVCGSIVLNYICIKFFVEVCNIWPTPSKALTTAVSVIYSYLASRYFAFRIKGN